jgi:hypothetical protein
MRRLLLLVLLLAGCTRTVYVPRQEVRTEYVQRVSRDSVVVRDSVFVRAVADTLYIYRDRWRDRYHTLRDTVVVRDSVAYPVVVEVEKPVRRIPALYRWSLWIAIAAVVWVGVKVFRQG